MPIWLLMKAALLGIVVAVPVVCVVYFIITWGVEYEFSPKRLKKMFEDTMWDIQYAFSEEGQRNRRKIEDIFERCDW